MPPEGYTSVTVSDEVVSKLARLMAQSGCEGYSEAIEYAADECLAGNGQLTPSELAQMLCKRLE
jgi:metal-responsive CopG/Arc/MetJ family transcriptional regulator